MTIKNFTAQTTTGLLLDYHSATQYLCVDKYEINGDWSYRKYNLPDNGHTDPFELMNELADYYGQIIYPSLVYLD